MPCRQQVTAAPVRAHNVDNILEQLMEPVLDATERADRKKRQAEWKAGAAGISARLRAAILPAPPPLPPAMLHPGMQTAAFNVLL